MPRSVLNRASRSVRRPVRWCRSHWILASLFSALGLAGLVNYVAYRHAYAFTHFTPDGLQPPTAESLTYADLARFAWSGISLPRSTNKYTPHDVALPFSTRRIDLDQGDSLEAWYIDHEQPRGMVLMFHGYSACKASLLTEARLFHEAGFAELLVDFRGSGGSSGDDTTIGVREADDVAATVAYARSQWGSRPLILFGQSMGSAAIMRALSRLDVQADVAVLETPFDRLLTTVQNRFEIVRVPAFPLADLMVFWGGVQFGFNGFQHNPVDYARGCRCPVLLLQGEKDDKVNETQMQAIFENLPATRELHVMAGLGHESFARGRPKEWTRVVGRFLDQQLARMRVQMAAH